MSSSSRRAAISFEDELPLPEINLLLYRRIYVLEQWLRRIALAALTARYGPRWNDALPTEMGKNLKSRIASLKNRVAFNTEDSDNAIWALTLDELKSLLTYDKIWPVVRELTEFDRQDLRARLEELREIRNVIGHNRAATDYTGKIFEAIDESISDGVNRFRDRLLYDFSGSQQRGTDSDDVVNQFYRSASPLGQRQIATDEYFYYIYVLVPSAGNPVGLADLLEHFDAVRRVVLSFLINRQRLGEYTLVWPRSGTTDDHSSVLERFEVFQPVSGEAYSAQNPKYVCHPKVWFVY